MPSAAALAVGFAITVLATALQRVVGIGMAIVSVPILATMHPALAPVPQSLISVPLVFWMAWNERHDIDIGSVKWVLLGRIPGAVLGVWLITILDPDALAIAMGLLVLFATAMVWRGINIRRRPPVSFATGVTSGFMALVAAIGGPPLALLFRNSPPATVRASLATVFAFGVVVTIAARAVTGNISAEEMGSAAILLPAIPLGMAVGARLARQVEAATTRAAIIVLAALGAIGLIARTLLA